MTEVTDKPTLQLNDKNFIIEDLSDQARYIVAQLQDLKQQEAQQKARLDQVVVAAEGFKTMLEKQIEDYENQKPEEPLEGEVMQ